MRHLTALIFLLFFVMSCSSGTTATSTATNNTTQVTPVNETIHITNNEGFDVVFKDNGFYSWLEKQDPKKNFYESTLEIQNSQYVNEWNKRVANPNMYDSNLYSHTINYEIKPKKRYGLDVNYELFMYFKFFEEKHEKLLEK
jgi:hypothetical protein